MKNPAYDKALKLIARRDHFRAELEEKLRRKGFEDNDIDAALERLDELSLLDDEALAERFVEFRSVDRGWGPWRLANELRTRGVDQSLAERVSQIGAELHDRALKTAVRRVDLRAKEGWWRLPERRARLVKSLIGRGFSSDVAYDAVARLAAEREKTDHETDDQPGDPGRLS
ncbi:MAG: regulatory protein RecX [Thermoanaerobaculales bacterium]|jgi:regulatory protein|nr:regulatory protein RecX [Thermoanaerobaculales bacterium]